MKIDRVIQQNKIKKYALTVCIAVGLTACGGGGDSSGGLSKVKDSDGDGFHDAIDPAPHDASNPGDFSSPEKILANPAIKVALNAAKKHGVTIRTYLGHNPPNLSGYYVTPAGGRVLATQTGKTIGRRLVAGESRVRTKAERYEEAAVYHSRGKGIAFSYTKGSFLRGEGNNFTTYSPYKQTCTLNGSNYSIYGVTIDSATANLEGGTISGGNSLVVNLAFSGKLTRACEAITVGGSRSKWNLNHLVSSTKIEDASDLNYMCVDDNKAYIPEETWENSDKQSCKCTTEYKVECE